MLAAPFAQPTVTIYHGRAVSLSPLPPSPPGCLAWHDVQIRFRREPAAHRVFLFLTLGENENKQTTIIARLYSSEVENRFRRAEEQVV